MSKKNAIVNSASDGSAGDNFFPEKWSKKLPTGWQDTASTMTEEELKKVIFECEGNIYTIEKEKAADVKLQGAREIVKEHAAPYRDAKSTQEAKIKFALYLLENRGVDLDSQEDK